MTKTMARLHFQRQQNHHYIIQEGGVAAMGKNRPMDLKLSTYVCYDIESLSLLLAGNRARGG